MAWGAALSVVSEVPLSLTDTAFREMSHEPVTWAVGAFARSHCLKSLRSAESCARTDFVVPLLKSIFLPGAGLVLTSVESGAPLSWTSAYAVSTVAPADGRSDCALMRCGEMAPTGAAAVIRVAAGATAR